MNYEDINARNCCIESVKYHLQAEIDRLNGKKASYLSKINALNSLPQRSFNGNDTSNPDPAGIAEKLVDFYESLNNINQRINSCMNALNNFSEFYMPQQKTPEIPQTETAAD